MKTGVEKTTYRKEYVEGKPVYEIKHTINTKEVKKSTHEDEINRKKNILRSAKLLIFLFVLLVIIQASITYLNFNTGISIENTIFIVVEACVVFISFLIITFKSTNDYEEIELYKSITDITVLLMLGINAIFLVAAELTVKDLSISQFIALTIMPSMLKLMSLIFTSANKYHKLKD